MKTDLKETITGRVVFLGVIGCLIFSGSLLLLVVKGCSNEAGKSALDVLHPYITEEDLNSTEPIELPLFPEPSLEGLVAQLKGELGLTDAEVAADAERIAQERELDIVNYMDSRRDLTARQAAWEERKRLVVAIPELLWKPGFVLPPALDVMELRDTSLYNYDTKHGDDFTITQKQDQRMSDLRTQAQRGEISNEEYEREVGKIQVENLDPLTAAKHFLTHSGTGSINAELGMEYAERAIHENPDSFEAHHVWTLCNRLYYLGTDDDKVIEGLRNLVDRFPNSSIAFQDLSWALYWLYPDPDLYAYPEEALDYVQRAIQLDDRIERNNSLLAICYRKLGEYEKALAVFQGMSEVHYGHGGGLLTYIYDVQSKVYKQRWQQGE